MPVAANAECQLSVRYTQVPSISFLYQSGKNIDNQVGLFPQALTFSTNATVQRNVLFSGTSQQFSILRALGTFDNFTLKRTEIIGSS